MRFLKLSNGSHREGQGLGCAMEAVAALNGEVWSDNPECVDPVISTYTRIFNDFLPDDVREQYITPELLISMIGTRGDLKDQVNRAKIAESTAHSVAHSVADLAYDSAAHLAAQHAAWYAARYAAKSAKSAEQTENIYRDCVRCINEMIKAGPHAPKEPTCSFEEIAEKFGGFVEVST